MRTNKKYYLLLAIIMITAIIIALSGCVKGSATQRLSGDEPALPQELKGLKVYTVHTGGIGEIKVAILNGEVNSLTYPVGKTEETTIVINKGHYDERVIEAEEILSETDEIIVIKKK